MNKRELVKLLKKNGWEIPPGSRHDLATNPNWPGVKIPITAHRTEQVHHRGYSESGGA
jgi:hypothetical protein